MPPFIVYSYRCRPFRRPQGNQGTALESERLPRSSEDSVRIELHASQHHRLRWRGRQRRMRCTFVWHSTLELDFVLQTSTLLTPPTDYRCKKKTSIFHLSIISRARTNFETEWDISVPWRKRNLEFLGDLQKKKYLLLLKIRMTNFFKFGSPFCFTVPLIHTSSNPWEDLNLRLLSGSPVSRQLHHDEGHLK
jgi:hypothetical protein